MRRLSQGYPQALNLPVPIYTPERILRHCESSVSPKNSIQGSQSGLEPRLLEIEKKYKNQITGCLHRLLTTFKVDNIGNGTLFLS